MSAVRCNMSAVSVFRDCGRASEEADDVDMGGVSEAFHTDIEVDISPVAVEAVVAAAGGVAVAALGDTCEEAWSLLAATVGGHSEAVAAPAPADDDSDTLAVAAYAPDDAVVLADHAAPAAPR